MKQLKRGILIFLCVLSSFGTLAGCGRNEEDNGAVKEENSADNTMNDATDGTKNDGVADDIGEDLKDEAKDIGEDVRDGSEDIKDDVEQGAEDAREDIENSNNNTNR